MHGDGEAANTSGTPWNVNYESQDVCESWILGGRGGGFTVDIFRVGKMSIVNPPNRRIHNSHVSWSGNCEPAPTPDSHKSWLFTFGHPFGPYPTLMVHSHRVLALALIFYGYFNVKLHHSHQVLVLALMLMLQTAKWRGFVPNLKRCR